MTETHRQLLFVSFPAHAYTCCRKLDARRQIKHTTACLFHSACVGRTLILYLHERGGLHGMKQAYPQMLVFIVHCYHIKADHFRHSQQDRNNPYQRYFHRCPHWNPDAFDSIPEYYSSVSAESMGKCYGLGDFLFFFVWNNNRFFSLRTFEGLILNTSVRWVKCR